MLLHVGAGLAGLLLLLCAFAGLGLGVFRLLRVRITPLGGIYAVAAGWGALVTVSILADYLAAPLRVTLTIGLIVGAGILAAGGWRGSASCLLQPVGIGLLAVLPAILSAASFASLQYDE